MRQLLALFLTLALFSCEKNSNDYSLNGEVIGFSDGTEIYVYAFEDRQPKVIDTLTVQDGKFSGTYPKSDELGLNFLRVKDINASILFFPENDDMKAVIYADSIQDSRVTGGKQNDAYDKFATKLKYFNKKKQVSMDRFRDARQNNDEAELAAIQSQNLNLVNEETEFKKQYLKENNNSLFSIMLLSEMVSRKEITPTEASEYIAGLGSKLADNEITQDLKINLESLKKADVGSMAPDFSGPSPTGETISLKDALGKYTIIDFWASWCRPCRVENPNVVKVYNQFHKKGLNIISVSLDKEDQKDKWIQAIKDDKMDWFHISHLQFWSDPIAAQYNVRSIPATFLLDENGMIIDKDLRGPALEAKIASLFAE